MFYISSDNLWACMHTIYNIYDHDVTSGQSGVSTDSQGVYHNITSYIIIQVISTYLVNSYTIQLICLFWEVLGRLGFAAMLGSRSQQQYSKMAYGLTTCIVTRCMIIVISSFFDTFIYLWSFFLYYR